jgi:DNA-binding transcriptional ArsR family regulator
MVTLRDAPTAFDPDPAGCGTAHSHDPAGLERLRQMMLDSGTVESVAELFKLLADPTRVRIVDVLSRGERCVFDIASLVGLSESAVSHQLRLLRSARLVRVRRAGRHAYYSLDDHHVVGLIHDGRRHVEEAR